MKKINKSITGKKDSGESSVTHVLFTLLLEKMILYTEWAVIGIYTYGNPITRTMSGINYATNE